MATRVVTVNEYDRQDRLVRQTVTTYEMAGDPDRKGESVIPLATGGVVTPPVGFRSGGVTLVEDSPYTITVNVSNESAEALGKRLAEFMRRDAKRRGSA